MDNEKAKEPDRPGARSFDWDKELSKIDQLAEIHADNVSERMSAYGEAAELLWEAARPDAVLAKSCGVPAKHLWRRGKYSWELNEKLVADPLWPLSSNDRAK